MSSLIVEVVNINNIIPHPNGDFLEIAYIKGWTCVVKRDTFKINDKAVYFPIDCVLPKDISDRLGVTNYLSKQRIRAAKLRGCVSYGLLIPCENENWSIGDDVADYYKVTKYEPPQEFVSGDTEIEKEKFIKYTNIRNHKNFPNVLKEGEKVVVTEKIHGTNSRVGLIDGEFMAGSHALRRKKPEDNKISLYWYPLELSGIKDMLEYLGSDSIIFGEIYGSKIQNLQYGLDNGKKEFRIFDIYQNNKYMDYHLVKQLCLDFNVEMVPILYEGDYNFEKVNDLAQGNSVIPNANHIREGVVVKPVKERWDEKVGRVILKHISDAHELTKNKTDRH